MRFKRIFLVFVLAILMLAGVAWAEDDDDQGEDDVADGSVVLIGNEGPYCYLSFALADGTYAQAMVYDTQYDVVDDKVIELVEKYVDAEGGELTLAICGTPDVDSCFVAVIGDETFCIGECSVEEAAAIEAAFKFKGNIEMDDPPYTYTSFD